MALEAVQFIRNEEQAAADRLTAAQERCAEIQADAKARIAAIQAAQQAQARREAAVRAVMDRLADA